ncbi:outer membrane beta-barrel protein [Ferruginibacter lapsinanis]|uniref:outer membrane beta-barrel protein n=1 Tax=Ferruginibacter lapsinanis TaxID=563172 RepID=UPI001E31A88E|nr:outer membrane beta-barrel protein [Ferruginibacter lapsinanis]UEG50877.1 outer membrane beta-barrel protein [Ferruginibacter lapsinanis]
MKSNNNYKTAAGKIFSGNRLNFKNLIAGALIVTAFQTPVQAQEATYTKPSWWFGAAAGANINFYRGSTQELNADFTPPVAFHNGTGVGLYVAPLIEYHNPASMLGVMLQAGYDSRKGSFKTVNTPCNCPADLSTDLSYVTIEPSLRLAPAKSNFYLYAGPRFAFNVKKSFTYKLGINPAYPGQAPNADVKGDLSNIKNSLISMQVGAGYDIPISSQTMQTQFVLSPFVSFQPYFGQSPRTTETWNVTTLRVGAALKFGMGKKISRNPETVGPMNTIQTLDPSVKFTVYVPENDPTKTNNIKETFPIRNYVFFDLGSSAIPDRYELLKKDQVKNFKEDNLDQFVPKNLSGRSERQMTVYYNVLNILGDRMGKTPSATIKLVGSSESGPEDGQAMAMSIKDYLVNIFGINANRIAIEGNYKPKIPSEQPGRTTELILLREGDRRVSIESSSPLLLMEFQSGPSAPLKPVEIVTAPKNSYVVFMNEDKKKTLSSWSVEAKDENGKRQSFGPYTQEKVSIPGKSILGNTPQGNYRITMKGVTNDGKIITKDTLVHLVLWTPAATGETLRYSVIYEFNESKAISIYEKYLTDVVTPKISAGATVVIHGYTDIIGDEIYNRNLSLARANDVKGILENSLARAGRSDVKFEVFGLGEDERVSPFENKFPEERFYNRTVVIDIIPKQ